MSEDSSTNNESPSSSNSQSIIADKVRSFPRDNIKCDGPECSTFSPRSRCSRCHCNYYCSPACQKKDWPNHKPYCVPVEEMRRKQFEQDNTSNDSTSETSSTILNHSSSEKAVNEECPICLEQPIQNMVVLKGCNHGFCSTCIIQWQQYRKLMADLVVDFESTSDSVIPEPQVEVRRKAMSCPYCRAQSDENFEEDLMQRAMLLATRASSSKHKISKEAREELLKQAISCLDQIIETDVPLITVFYSKAEILLELDEAEKALDTLKRLFETNEARKLHPVMKLLDEQDEAVARFDRARYEQLKEEIVLAAEEHGMPATRLRQDAVFEAYMLQCQAYEKLEKWNDALDTYKQAGLLLDELPNLTPPKQRQFYFGLGRCFYEAKMYDKAITIIDVAITMNRHYPGVHKYKAWAQEKLGNFDAAIKTMSEAVLYETPWDHINQEECLNLYDELVARAKECDEVQS